MSAANSPRPVPGDTRWLLWFCASRMAFATTFVTYSATLPLLRREWAMSAGEAGLIQSAFHVGFLVSLFAVGFISEHYGARRTFLASGVAAVASGLAFALFADGFTSALLLYGLTGLLSGGSYTPGLTLLAERYAGGGQGRAMGFYLAAASLGYALSMLATSAVVPIAGWRGAFIATALGPVAGLVIGQRMLRDVPNLIHPAPEGHGVLGSLGAVLANRPAMLSVWGYTWHAWELLGLWAWLPAYLTAALAWGGEFGAGAVSLGAILTALTYLISVAGSASGGALSDRHGRTAVILWLSCASALCSLAFGWLIGGPLWLLVAVAVVYNFTGTADSSVHSSALSELVPPRHLGAAFALRSVLGFGAGAVSPWILGLVLDFGRGPLESESAAWGLAWTTLGIGALLGPLATWKLRRSPESARLAKGLR